VVAIALRSSPAEAFPAMSAKAGRTAADAPTTLAVVRPSRMVIFCDPLAQLFNKSALCRLSRAQRAVYSIHACGIAEHLLPIPLVLLCIPVDVDSYADGHPVFAAISRRFKP